MALNIWSTLLVRLPMLAAYAVGVLVGLALVVRRRDAAAWLALIGFGLLLATQLGGWLMNALPLWLASGGAYSLAGVFTCLNVVFSLCSAGGALCLAAALWIGVARSET